MTTETDETLDDAIERARETLVPVVARMMRTAILAAASETDWEAAAREALAQCHDITDAALVTDAANQSIQSIQFTDAEVSA